MPHQALRSILPVAGWSADRADTVAFSGGTDPILPTPFRIGVAGSATLAATGLAAADLWELRTGRRQSVAVDLRRATASLRSGHYMKLGDGEVSARRNSIMGVYPTKDGRWSYLHCNFPNHRAAALSVLGVAEDRDAVTRAVATWNAADLEEAIIAAKGAGGMVRTKAEWATHPQSAAIAGLPLMEIVRIGDSRRSRCRGRPAAVGRPRARSDARARRPDLRAHAGGAWRGRAEGHRRASAQPGLPGVRHRSRQAVHAPRSARAARCRCAARAGARGRCVLAGLSARHARARGLSPEELAAIRPGLVYVSLCAFGHAGPWASRRGFDTVVQTVSGITTRQAEVVPGKTPGPQFYPVSAIDYCTGYLMAFGAMVALARRAREGGSWLVRISLAQVGKVDRRSGRGAGTAARDAPAEFAAEELERWSMVSDTPSGRLRHLKPVVQMSETPPHWARPSVPLGYHQPEWPAR